MAMNFNVEVDLVPVTINGETFNFGATEENLIKFFDFEKEVKERGNKLKKELDTKKKKSSKSKNKLVLEKENTKNVTKDAAKSNAKDATKGVVKKQSRML